MNDIVLFVNKDIIKVTNVPNNDGNFKTIDNNSLYSKK